MVAAYCRRVSNCRMLSRVENTQSCHRVMVARNESDSLPGRLSQYWRGSRSFVSLWCVKENRRLDKQFNIQVEVLSCIHQPVVFINQNLVLQTFIRTASSINPNIHAFNRAVRHHVSAQQFADLIWIESSRKLLEVPDIVRCHGGSCHL